MARRRATTAPSSCSISIGSQRPGGRTRPPSRIFTVDITSHQTTGPKCDVAAGPPRIDDLPASDGGGPADGLHAGQARSPGPGLLLSGPASTLLPTSSNRGVCGPGSRWTLWRRLLDAAAAMANSGPKLTPAQPEVRLTDRDGTATVRPTDRSGTVIGTATPLLSSGLAGGRCWLGHPAGWDGTGGRRSRSSRSRPCQGSRSSPRPAST